VQVSGAQFTPHGEGEAIRFGLAAVKNVGGNAIESIMKARAEAGGRFKSFWEFCEKVDLRVMNKRVIESLIKAGALDSLGTRGQLMAPWTRRWSGRRRRRRMRRRDRRAVRAVRRNAGARARCGRFAARADWEESERLANEKEVLGFFVSGHPLDKYAEKLRNP
jgi:DNA polymerase III subunit alpha